MRVHHLVLISGLLMLATSGCKKDFHPGDTIEVVDTVAAVNATTLDTAQGFGVLPIGAQSAGWTPANTLLILPVPFNITQGDSLIASVQILLQRNDRDPSEEIYDCERDSLSVTLGTFLQPFSTNSPPSSLEPVEHWLPGAAEGEWIKAYTLVTRMRAGNDVPAGAVVQVFAKLWPEVGCVPAAGASCNVLSRSLTLTVVHP